MGEKPIDLEWLDESLAPMTYDDAQEYILNKNQGLSRDGKRWRLPLGYELRIMRKSASSGFSLRGIPFMCMSSRVDGRISAIDSDGKFLFFDKKTPLHFCLVR